MPKLFVRVFYIFATGHPRMEKYSSICIYYKVKQNIKSVQHQKNINDQKYVHDEIGNFGLRLKCFHCSLWLIPLPNYIWIIYELYICDSAFKIFSSCSYYKFVNNAEYQVGSTQKNINKQLSFICLHKSIIMKRI